MAQATIKREDEEAIIKRKLLYDGHGMGEDKKLVAIIKNTTKLYLNEYPPAEFQKIQEILVKDITAAINSCDRQLQVSDRCDRTISTLNKTIQEEENRLVDVKSELIKLELELDYVEKLKEINQYPDCTSTEAAINELKAKMDDLMGKIKKNRLHMTKIIESCQNMRPVIEDSSE